MTENTIQELEAREDISVKFLNMDPSITEQITKNSDGSYSVFLNSRLNHDKHLMGYKHALQHILDGDFDNATNKNIQQIEVKAHDTSVPASAPLENNDTKDKIAATRKIDFLEVLYV